jgi:hypothetical protein
MSKKEDILEEDNRINSRINTIDFRKFVMLTPEFDKESIFNLIKKLGFGITPLNKDASFFTIDAYYVPREDAEDVADKLNEIKDIIKKSQLDYYDQNQDKIPMNTQILDLMAKFLSDSNVSKQASPDKLNFILSSIFEDLYLSDEEDVRFLCPDTIDHLSKAAVSRKLEDAKLHLEQASVDILIQIRKLAILWFYKSISLDMYNLRTDKSDIYKLQRNKEVIMGGRKYEVIPMNIHNKQYNLAYSEEEFSLTTFELGIKNQNMITPILAAIFIDKASLEWRYNYSQIIIKAISRLKDQTRHQLKNLQLEYDKISIEQLVRSQKELDDSFEFLFQMLFRYKNNLESSNQQLRHYYQNAYSRQIGVILGGAISNAIRKVTPLESLDRCDALIKDLNVSMKDVSNLKFEVMSLVKDLIKQKQEENPTLFKKTVRKIQDIGENLIAKTVGELLKGNLP